MAKVSNKSKESDKPKKKRGFPKSTCSKECPVGYGMNQFVVSKGTEKELTRHYCKKVDSPIGEKLKQPVKEKKPKKIEEPSIVIPSSKIEPEKPSKKIKEPVKEKEESMFSPKELEEMRKYKEEKLDPKIKEDLRQLEERIKELKKEEKPSKVEKKPEIEIIETPELKLETKKISEGEWETKVKEKPLTKKQIKAKQKEEYALRHAETMSMKKMAIAEQKIREKQRIKEMKEEYAKEGSFLDELESKPYDNLNLTDELTGCKKYEPIQIAKKVFPYGIDVYENSNSKDCIAIDQTRVEGIMSKVDFDKSTTKKTIKYDEKGIYEDCKIAGIHPRGTYWLTNKDNTKNVEVKKDMLDYGIKNFKKSCKCENNKPIVLESKRNTLLIAPRISEEEHDEETWELKPTMKPKDFKESNMSLEQYDTIMKKSKAELEKMSKPEMNRGKPKKAKNKEELVLRYWEEQLAKEK